MKFVYFGSSDFSSIILSELCDKGHKPSLVISQPDRPKGRGLKVLPTKVSCYAQRKKIPLGKPKSLRDSRVREQLCKEEADLFVVADYGRILPSDYFSLARICLGIHPSLLPRYRGPAPINWAIINGESTTGVSIFKINNRIDAGDIILQKKVTIDDEDDLFSLTDKLAKEGVSLLLEAVDRIERKDYALKLQDEYSVSFAPKLGKKEGKISWNSSPRQIRNLIRGTLGWPSAYTYYKDKSIKLLDAEAIESNTDENSGVIVKVDREGIYVAASGGILKIKKLKPQGKREMDGWSFACGYRVKEGEAFS